METSNTVIQTNFLNWNGLNSLRNLQKNIPFLTIAGAISGLAFIIFAVLSSVCQKNEGTDIACSRPKSDAYLILQLIALAFFLPALYCIGKHFFLKRIDLHKSNFSVNEKYGSITDEREAINEVGPELAPLQEEAEGSESSSDEFLSRPLKLVATA